MSRLLSSLPVGSLVKDSSITYLGTTPIFRILEHGHSGDPAGSTTLECKDGIDAKAFDAKEPNNPIIGIANYGNNRYRLSNILQWLNSNESAGNWYSAQHQYDEPPSTAYLQENKPNAYYDKAGFLTFLSSSLRSALMEVSKPTYDYDNDTMVNVASKFFLLSETEVGLGGATKVEGSVYGYYRGGDNTRRVKVFASEAAKGDWSGDNIGNNWLLRSRGRDNDFYIFVVNTNGARHYTSAFGPASMISPAFCISSDTVVSDNPDSDGAYTFVFNATPTISPASTNYGNVTAPPSITTTITDPDGDSFTYTVKLNGTTKTSGSATGTKTFAIDTTGYWPLMALGSNTITVQATDSNGATVSATYTMNKTNSAAPVPTTDLVNNTRKETSFYIGFQIGLDADGDSQTVVAQVSSSSSMSNPTEFSGVEKEVAGAWLPVQTLTNADVGARLRIQVTGQTVGNTIYVRLKDTDSGSGTPVYTSTYAIVIGSVLEFNTLPIVRTEKPSLVVAYLNKTKPADATLAMYACNNANDGAPTWEPITEGETHQFTNKTKTAQNWAVSVKTSITAGATAGEISVSAVGLGVL